MASASAAAYASMHHSSQALPQTATGVGCSVQAGAAASGCGAAAPLLGTGLAVRPPGVQGADGLPAAQLPPLYMDDDLLAPDAHRRSLDALVMPQGLNCGDAMGLLLQQQHQLQQGPAADGTAPRSLLDFPFPDIGDIIDLGD